MLLLPRKEVLVILGVYLFLLPYALQAETPPTITRDISSSKILRMAGDDTITINGVIHRIPPPWLGNKLEGKKLVFEDFALIPLDATWQGSKLYLVKEAQKALVAMLNKAKEEGVSLIAHSAYRSQAYQTNIFRKMMAEGRNFADIIRYVAPPGYSEHMLGTVVDFYPSNWNFANLETYQWLQENAELFGFFESYPEAGSQGAPWEPWHWRFQPEETLEAHAKNTEEQ